MSKEAKKLFIDYIKSVKGEDLKQFILGMVEDMPEDDFHKGHDNGYNDGDGELQDIWIDNLMFDCRIKETV